MSIFASEVGVPLFEKEAIIERYKILAISATNLRKEVDQACINDTPVKEESIVALKAAWRVLAIHWSHTSILSGPPVEKDNRSLRINAWPNRKNSVEKQIALALSSDETLNVEYVRQASVLLQGIPTLEALIFDEAFQTQEKHCELMTSVSDYLSNTFNALVGDWETYHDESASKDILDDAFNGLRAQLKFIQKYKLPQLLQATTLPLGPTSEFPRSGASFSALGTNLLSACEILSYAQGDVGDNISIICSIITRTVDEVEVLEETGSIPDETKQTMIDAVATLILVLEKDFMPAYGVTVDFNSIDGD